MSEEQDELACEILNYYTEDQWQEAIDRATLLATRVTKKAGLEAQEWVHDAISKLLSGERSWHPDKHSLSKHLTRTFLSDYSHFVEKSKKHTSFNANDHHHNQNPEKVYACDQALDSIKNKISESNDPLAQKVIFAYEKYGYDAHQNSEVAEHAGVEINDIVNTKKRIKRITNKQGGS